MLNIGGRNGPRPGGPPLGLNIIINSASPVQWPPTVQIAQPMGYAPPPVGYAPPPASYAPPPADYGSMTVAH